MDETHLASIFAVVFSRASERILLVLVGALSVYLGYRLFVLIPKADKSEGKFELPGGVSIFLTRIGPGVFFALFGVAVIGYSVTRPIEFKLPTGPGGAIEFSSLGGRSDVPPTVAAGAPSAVEAIAIAGPEPRAVVAYLNGLMENASANLSAPAAEEFAVAVRSAKIAVILASWDPNWGDRAAFAAWAEENETGDPPPGIAPGAAMVFGGTIR